jgi:manganese transport protein
VTRAETVQTRGRVRTALALFGPAFVASVAYVDPGNFATNFAAGAQHGYLLVWVVLMANAMAIVVQYLTAKIGLTTERSLPELSHFRFGRYTNLMLWLQAEAIAIATDMAEFVGAALGLNLLFGVPPLAAGLITAVVAFSILILEQQGYRRFELAIIALLGVVATGLVYTFFAAGHQDYGALAHGLLPRIEGKDSLELAVGIIGATVMPHAIYLHSALQAGRVPPCAGAAERRRLLRYNFWDCIGGLGGAGLINLSMLCIAAAVLHRRGWPDTGDLAEVHGRIATTVGGTAALAFAIALIASGFSSSSVGIYAGQIVMAGFTNWRFPVVLRRLITMLPSLVVLGLSASTSQVLVYSQIVLSFGIPFALVPLVLLTADTQVMGDMVNRKPTTLVALVITVVITLLNGYLLITALIALA